jgi:ankyrin repeat protein
VDARGCSALLAAAQRGDVQTMNTLVSHGAHLEGPRLPVEGWTALHAAAAGGHESATLWLLQAGANLSTKDNVSRGRPRGASGSFVDSHPP